MMQRFEITASPDQRFAVTMNGRNVELRLRWNRETEHWSLDLYLDRVAVMVGRRIVPNINLIRRLHLGLGAIWAVGTAQGRDVFTDGDLVIYQADPDELEALA